MSLWDPLPVGRLRLVGVADIHANLSWSGLRVKSHLDMPNDKLQALFSTFLARRANRNVDKVSEAWMLLDLRLDAWGFGCPVWLDLRRVRSSKGMAKAGANTPPGESCGSCHLTWTSITFFCRSCSTPRSLGSGPRDSSSSRVRRESL